MNERPIEPGNVYLVNGLLCVVTFVGEKASVMFDDGSVDKLPLHELYAGVYLEKLPHFLTPFLTAMKAILYGSEPEPLYTDEIVQRAHRTGMLLGSMSTCDDIYARLLQMGKGTAEPSFQDAMRAVERYINGVKHLAIKDGIAETASENVIPLNRGGVQ